MFLYQNKNQPYYWLLVKSGIIYPWLGWVCWFKSRPVQIKKKKEVLEFKKEEIFRYNSARKKVFALSLISGAVLIAAFIIAYILVLKDSNLPLFNLINSIIKHVVLEIKNSTVLGIFYASAFGGLFFVFIPMEAAYITFLKLGRNNPVIAITAFMLGIILSYSLNYFVGLKLTNLSKRLISPRKFYSIKSKVNKYGGVAVFLFNLLVLHSQLLCVIRGVFKYNKKRYFTLFISGQLIKYIAITLGYIYIFK